MHLVCGSGKIATSMRLEKHIDEIALSEQIKSIVFAVAVALRIASVLVVQTEPRQKLTMNCLVNSRCDVSNTQFSLSLALSIII